MSNRPQSSGETAGGDRNSSVDTQALVGLLENLVPLLLHFQSQSLTPNGPVNLAGPHGAHLDQQAAVAFTEDVILDSLRNLTGYLQQNGNRYPGLDTYATVVTRARQALAARDYQTAFGLILDAYRAITVVRSIRPELPPIRQRDQNEQAQHSGAAANGAVH